MAKKMGRHSHLELALGEALIYLQPSSSTPRQEKVGLGKWEVAGEPFLLLLDNLHLAPREAREELEHLVRGATFPHCSVVATSTSSPEWEGWHFDLVGQLRGWRQEVVMELIHRQFPHTPNKVAPGTWHLPLTPARCTYP